MVQGAVEEVGVNSADAYRILISMLRFMYEECQKRSADPNTEHVLAVTEAVDLLMRDKDFRGEAMQMAMMLISFGRLYQELGGQARIILKKANSEEAN